MSLILYQLIIILRITENIGLALEFFDENLLIVILVIKILVGQKEGIDDVH
jgi:hypothetical protein